MRRAIRLLLLLFIFSIAFISSVILLSQQFDNSIIAYTISEDVRHSSVQLIDGRTGQILNVIHNIGEGDILGRSPLWSPDGQRLAFWTIHNRSDSLAFEIEIENYLVTNLTEQYGYFSMPIYGANNQQLYATLPTVINVPISLINDVYPDGEQILASTLSIPEWSPDGRYIAYLNRYEDLETGESLSSGTIAQDIDLYVMDTISGDIINYTIAFNNIGTPIWSPDGTQIAFIATQTNFGQIYILDIGTGTINEIPIRTNAVGRLVWSPDSQRIAFTSNQPGENNTLNGEVMVLDIASLEMQNISQSTHYDTDPTWSPDGNLLAFTSRRDGNQSDIFIANIKTGQLRQITFTDANETELIWQPH